MFKFKFLSLPKNILNESDVSVANELQDGDLEDSHRLSDGGRVWWLLAAHPHWLAAELLRELCQLCAGFVEPAVTVTAHPLSCLRHLCHLGVLWVHGRVQELADAAGDKLLLLAVLACHVLDLGEGVELPARHEKLAPVKSPFAGLLSSPLLYVVVAKLYRNTHTLKFWQNVRIWRNCFDESSDEQK